MFITDKDEKQLEVDKIIEDLKEELGDSSDLDIKKNKCLTEGKSERDYFESLSDEEFEMEIAKTLLFVHQNHPEKIVIIK